MNNTSFGTSPVWPIVIAVVILAAAGATYWATQAPQPPTSISTGSIVLTGTPASGTTNSGATLSGATASGTAVSLANPASVHCTASGGTIVIKKNPIGNEYGVCYFEDNRQCEEWRCTVVPARTAAARLRATTIRGDLLCHFWRNGVYGENAGSCSADDYFANGTACKRT